MQPPASPSDWPRTLHALESIRRHYRETVFTLVGMIVGEWLGLSSGWSASWSTVSMLVGAELGSWLAARPPRMAERLAYDVLLFGGGFAFGYLWDEPNAVIPPMVFGVAWYAALLPAAFWLIRGPAARARLPW